MDEKMNFSEKMNELDKILKNLEGETDSLEHSLAEFEKGIALVRQCRAYLEEARQRVTILSEDSGKTLNGGTEKE